MSTQDTTLPPLPDSVAVAISAYGDERADDSPTALNHYRAALAAVREWGAAIAAQAQQPSLDRDAAIRTWQKHYSAFRSTLGDSAEVPPSPVIDAMLDFAKAAQAQQAQGVPADHLPTKEHIRELAQEAVDQVMEQAQVFASAWALVGGRFDSGNAMEDAEEAKAELRTLVQSLADLAAETVRPAAAPQAEPQPEREPLSDEVESVLREALIALSFCGKSTQARALSAQAARHIKAVLD